MVIFINDKVADRLPYHFLSLLISRLYDNASIDRESPAKLL